MSDYPEHEKLQQCIDSGARGNIQRFLDWLLDEKQYTLAEWTDPEPAGLRDQELFPIFRQRAEIMAEFFGIDLDKIEQEKRAMLQTQRNLNRAAR